MSVKSVIKKFIRHPRSVLRSLQHPIRLRRFFHDMNNYNAKNTRPEFQASFKNVMPCLTDWDDSAASMDVIYFRQDLWAAKKIFQTRPSEHYDIGSRVDGFIAHVLSFMPVTMLDIRPMPYEVEGLNFIQADATNLEGIADNSLVSLSSLCAPEHFGLGRYGDPVDPEACFTALKSMQRVLARGGHLYIAVPVGDNSGVSFNAHRIFQPELVISTLEELRLVDFSVVNGKEEYLEHVSLEEFHAYGFGVKYWGGVVGLFEFVKD